MSIMPVVTAAAAVSSEEPVIHPYLVGLVSLGVLLALLVGLLMFGKGREHS